MTMSYLSGGDARTPLASLLAAVISGAVFRNLKGAEGSFARDQQPAEGVMLYVLREAQTI